MTAGPGNAAEREHLGSQKARVLYLTYDGVLEPLGQSQVIAYLERLAIGFDIHIISYEKKADWENTRHRQYVAGQLRRAGISWHPLRYHGRLPAVATSFDLARGFARALRVVRRNKIQIVHARSYVMSVIALALKRSAGIRYLFDMRGFWPDEKVDAGTWSRTSAVYRMAKRAERAFLTSADAVVSLTHAGVAAMKEFDYLQGCNTEFAVIPTCADLERFHPPSDPPKGSFKLGYVGNAGGWYRFEPVVAAFERIRAKRPDARLIVVNRGQHDAIQAYLAAFNVPAGSVELASLDFADVPKAVRQMDASAFFIEPTFSKQASAPTKLAEFLGSGVPCLVNDGVGDMGVILREARVGVVVDEISNDAAAEGAAHLLQIAADPAVRSRCVALAHRHFSLVEGAAAYGALYRRLGNLRTA